MARTGDEEREGQETQEGSRRVTLHPQIPTFADSTFYRFSQRVPYTSHARTQFAVQHFTFNKLISYSLLMLFIFIVPLSSSLTRFENCEDENVEFSSSD